MQYYYSRLYHGSCLCSPSSSCLSAICPCSEEIVKILGVCFLVVNIYLLYRSRSESLISLARPYLYSLLSCLNIHISGLYNIAKLLVKPLPVVVVLVIPISVPSVPLWTGATPAVTSVIMSCHINILTFHSSQQNSPAVLVTDFAEVVAVFLITSWIRVKTGYLPCSAIHDYCLNAH